MILYFKSSNGNRRVIANCYTIQEVSKEINNFLEEHKFKLYYTRIWYEPIGTKTPYEIVEKGRFVYDVGSHTEFFELEIENNEVDKLPKHMYLMLKESKE